MIILLIKILILMRKRCTCSARFYTTGDVSFSRSCGRTRDDHSYHPLLNLINHLHLEFLLSFRL